MLPEQSLGFANAVLPSFLPSANTVFISLLHHINLLALFETLFLLPLHLHAIDLHLVHKCATFTEAY